MTEGKDPVVAAIDDARALMDALLANDWAQVHVAGDDFAIFIARADGGANPLLAATEPEAPVAAATAAPVRTMTAPHVATLDWIAAVGDQIDPGQMLARLSVLDEPTELAAQGGGTVVRVYAVPGALVEYGAPLLDVAEAS